MNYALIDTARPGEYPARRLEVPAGQAVVLRPGRGPWSLSVVPASGGTVLAEVTVSPGEVAPDLCTWHPLGAAVTSAELYFVRGPVAAVRVSASAGALVELLT